MLRLRIKELRKERRMTQDDLADRACLSKSLLSEIETHKSPANTIRLEAIAAALDVDPRDLFEAGDAPVKTSVRPPQSLADDPMTVLGANAAASEVPGEVPEIVVSLDLEGRGEGLFLLSEPIALILRERLDDSVRDLAAERKRRAKASA